MVLSEAGYKAGSEVKLNIDPSFHPVPDVIATRGRIEQPYPTTAVEIVIEILSGGDPMPRMLTKCRTYRNWGFQNVYVVDPEDRMLFCWVGDGLQEVDRMVSLPVGRIWSALDKELS